MPAGGGGMWRAPGDGLAPICGGGRISVATRSTPGGGGGKPIGSPIALAARVSQSGGDVSFEGARAIPGGGGGNPSLDNMLCASATGAGGASPTSIGGAFRLVGGWEMPGGGGGRPICETCSTGGALIVAGACSMPGGGGGKPIGSPIALAARVSQSS